VSAMPASLVDDPAGLAFTPLRGHTVEFVTAIATPSNRRPSAAAKALLETILRQAPG
jgi:hypothetical protein